MFKPMLLTTQSRTSCAHCRLATQIRHASLLRRPKRPYTFTQLITLSDGSTFTHRTTSPAPIYRSTKDTKNNPLWNPSSQKLLNIEEDEAGRLRRFRKKFGRGFDAEAVADDGKTGYEESASGAQAGREESLMDLISGFDHEAENTGNATGKKEEAVKGGKAKGGQK